MRKNILHRLAMPAIVGLVLLVATVPLVQAQANVVTASVDRNTITTDEALVLTVSVDTTQGSADRLDLPQLDGFRILGTNTGTQTIVLNGVTTSRVVTQYTLQPLRPGDLTIPPISATVAGQVYTTEPIAITVTEGADQSSPRGPVSPWSVPAPSSPTAPPATSSSGGLPPLLQPGSDPWGLLNQLSQLLEDAPYALAEPLDPSELPKSLVGQDYFADATVDNPNPYQGEQVLHTLRFYRAVDPFGQIDYQPPKFSGFWSEQLPDQKQFESESAGRRYLVSELQTVLFPTVAGELVVDKGTLTVPSDLLTQGAILETQPISLTVKPLPDGAPEGFQGAVGDYTIAAEVDTANTMVGDTITHRVTITGAGNLDTLPDPIWPEVAGWRAFDTQSTTTAEFVDGSQTGARVYERVLVPTQAGDLALPAVEFVYFDPASETYQVVQTDPLQVAVAPDPNSPTVAATSVATSTAGAAGSALASASRAAAGGPAAATAELAAASPGLAPAGLAPALAAPPFWSTASRALPQQAGYWLLWGLPIALLAGQSLLQRRRRYLVGNAAQLRSRRAAREARTALEAARHSPEADAAAGRILNDYLGAKLGRSVTGMTRQGLSDLLRSRGIDPVLVDRVQTCLMLSEVGRYAPGGNAAAADELLAETGRVIIALDRVL